MGVFHSEQDYFGLDIGTSSIRVVQLKKGAKPALLTYGSIDVTDGSSASDSAADRTKVAALVKQLVRDARISTKNVVAGLSSAKVYASVIKTPKLGDAELAKAMKFQAEHYIPMSVNEVKLDYSVLGPGASEDELEVLLIAAPNIATEKYVAICDEAGLELMALEPNALALSRALLPASGQTVLLLDMGAFSSDITIAQNRLPKLLRSVSVGGNTFVKTVAQNLGLDDAQAEQFTRKFGLTQSKLEGQVFKALKPTIDLLVSEIQKSVQFFATQYPGVKIEKLVVTGGGSNLLELPAYLSTATNLPVEIANAWTNVAYPAKLQDKLAEISSQYGVAAGLAERMFLQ